MVDIDYIKTELAEIIEHCEVIDDPTYERLCRLYDTLDTDGGVMLDE